MNLLNGLARAAVAATLGFTAGEAIAARTLLADLLARPATGAGQPAMSALALEACLMQARALDRTGIAVDEQVLVIDREAAEGVFLQSQIQAEIPVLGGYDEKGLNDFQRRVIRHQELAQKFKNDFPAYQASQRAYNDAVGEFERDCSGAFTASDLDAAKKKLGIK